MRALAPVPHPCSPGAFAAVYRDHHHDPSISAASAGDPRSSSTSTASCSMASLSLAGYTTATVDIGMHSVYFDVAAPGTRADEARRWAC